MEQVDTLIFEAITKLRNTKKQPTKNSIHTFILKDFISLNQKQVEKRLSTYERK